MAGDRKKPRRRWLRRALITVTLIAVGSWWVGCTSYVRGPGSPPRATPVYLVKEAMHVGVVLPAASGGGFVEYGFGDWDWFGKGEVGSWNGTAAVLWPTQGALGRREWAVATEEALRERAYFLELERFDVDADRAAALRERLRAEWEAGQAITPPGGETSRRFEMVVHDQDYWFVNNCADVCAAWMEDLGCTVTWVPIRIWLRPSERASD